jgi:ubiquinone/menaquinone biosynthesis C-methylase UbiE
VEQARRTYIPAAGHDWFLPLYDPFCRLMGAGSLHRQLVAQADIRPDHRVLEVGCGTGNLTVLVKRLHPRAEVTGLDPDPKALARAHAKAARAGLPVRLDEGFGDALPYAADSFDRVLSAFMFHHLERAEKRTTLRETRRVLEAAGSLHLLDFGGSGLLAHLLHRSGRLRDNTEDRVLALMQDAGFADATVAGRRGTVFGRVTYYRAAGR